MSRRQSPRPARRPTRLAVEHLEPRRLVRQHLVDHDPRGGAGGCHLELILQDRARAELADDGWERAVRVASALDEGNVVFVVPDDGWKYLSSGVYTKPLEELEDSLDSASFW